MYVVKFALNWIVFAMKDRVCIAGNAVFAYLFVFFNVLVIILLTVLTVTTAIDIAIIEIPAFIISYCYLHVCCFYY